MSRFLCDFYVYKTSQQLVAKYVNAILSQSEAQATANAFLKQYGATRVCAVNKGSSGAPPRAPVKSASTTLPAGVFCWVQAPQVMGQQATPVKKYVGPDESKFDEGMVPVEPKCPPGTERVNGLCVPVQPKVLQKPTRRPYRSPVVAGPFDGLGRAEGDGMVGLSINEIFILVAYKGNKILKHWEVSRTYTSGAFSHTDWSWAERKTVAKDYWPGVKKLGADRLCVSFADVHFDSKDAGYLCYNGYGFTKGLTPPVAGQQINCPAGQVWDNAQKKCVLPSQGSHQSNAETGSGVVARDEGEAFGLPSVRSSSGAAPQLSPLKSSQSTSFLRPQLSGAEDEREQRLEAFLGAAYTPGASQGRAAAHQQQWQVPSGTVVFGEVFKTIEPEKAKALLQIMYNRVPTMTASCRVGAGCSPAMDSQADFWTFQAVLPYAGGPNMSVFYQVKSMLPGTKLLVDVSSANKVLSGASTPLVYVIVRPGKATGLGAGYLQMPSLLSLFGASKASRSQGIVAGPFDDVGASFIETSRSRPDQAGRQVSSRVQLTHPPQASSNAGRVHGDELGQGLAEHMRQRGMLISPKKPWRPPPDDPRQQRNLPFALGDLSDIAQALTLAKYKGLLQAWTKSPGVSSPVPNYGTLADDLSGPWNCMRDGRVLSGFAKWWNTSKGGSISQGYFPASGPCKGILVADLTDMHKAALDAWAAGANVVVEPSNFPSYTPPPPPGGNSAACLANCENKYGMSGGNWNAIELANCVAACAASVTPSGGGVSPAPVPGGGAPAPVPGAVPPPGVQDCGGPNSPCPAGQTCIEGKCQPNLPAPPSDGTAPAKSSNVGLWVVGGAAVLGAAALIFGGGGKK